MTIKHDIKLTLIGNNYDISISGGDIETEDSFNSAILTSIFTEARANKDQIVISENRRGWIGNIDGQFTLGSTAWVYGQLRNIQSELDELASVYKLSLAHFVDDDRAKKVSASINIVDNQAVLSIRIERPNNRVDYRHYELWENTGV